MENLLLEAPVKRGRGRPRKTAVLQTKVKEKDDDGLVPKAPRKAARFLAELQLDDHSIALYLKISIEDLLAHYRYDIDLHRLKSRVMLLDAQFKKAKEGNTTMLIWLGKHYLNQRDDVKLTSVEPEIRLLIKKIEQIEDQREGILKKPYYDGEPDVDVSKLKTIEIGGDSTIETEVDSD